MMKNKNAFIKWTFWHSLVIPLSLIPGLVTMVLVHGSYGYSMADAGTYLSNTLMHIASGIVLAAGTGLFQLNFLRKQIRIPGTWVWSLIAGFVTAELLAGLLLWKLSILRGLINLFNTDVHYAEAGIFAFAGLIAGLLQGRMLRQIVRNRVLWALASAIGWGSCILFTSFGLIAFFAGALVYGALTGLVLFCRRSADQTVTKT